MPEPEKTTAQALPPTVKHRRYLRNYIIDKSLQLRYIGVVSLLSAGVCALLGYLIWSQRNQASQTLIESLVNTDFVGTQQRAEIVQRLTQSDSSMVWTMALICAGLIVVLSMFLVVMTHKVAGPLHVIGIYLDRLAAGRLPLVHNLRHGDELQIFHKKFKDMCNSLRVRAETDIALSEGLLAACKAAGVDESGALGHALEDMRKMSREKDASLGG